MQAPLSPEISVPFTEISGSGVLEVLRGVDFAVAQGSIFALLGSNGAGKSTTLNTVSRLVPVTKGRIRFAGERFVKEHLERLIGRE